MKLQRNIKDEFIKVFDETYSNLCNYSMSFVNDREAARDIVHDAFVYLWNKRDEINVESSLKGYILRVVKNYSIDYLRHNEVKRKHMDGLEYHFQGMNEDEYADHEHLISKIKLLIEELPPQRKKAFTLNVLEGKKYKEVAEEMDISVNSVKTHLSKAVKYIREEVGEKSLILFILSLDKK